jgi:hypothetical protein
MKEIPAMKRTALLATAMPTIGTPALALGNHNEKLVGLLHILVHNPGLVLIAGLVGILAVALLRNRRDREG